MAKPVTVRRLLVGVALLLSSAVWYATAAPPSSRDVALTYVARLTAVPRDAKIVHVWIPLAKTLDGQTVVERIVHAPVPSTVTQDPDYGNDMLYVAPPSGALSPFEIRIDYRVRLDGRGGFPHPASAEELQRSLQPHRLVIIDEEVRARARRATEGRSTRLSRARGFYDDVIRRMAYDKTAPGWGRGDTRRACLLGRGNCTDFHSLFISMARADGIPARFKIGWLLPDQPEESLAGYHCWAEFYHPHLGWVAVDASEAWKHPEQADRYFGTRALDRVLLTVGRDIRLTPPQAGEPVNIFFYPYVEVDGHVFQGVETSVAFRDGEGTGGAT